MALYQGTGPSGANIRVFNFRMTARRITNGTDIRKLGSGFSYSKTLTKKIWYCKSLQVFSAWRVCNDVPVAV